MVQAEVATLTQDATIQGPSKSGGSFSYKGISAAQVVARAKAALISYGVLYIPEVDRTSFRQDGNKTSIWVSGVFENVDDPSDTITRGAWGAGTDNADNGYAKAFTNANKQILTKTLNMTTVEDDTLVSIEHEPNVVATVVREAVATSETALRSWADAYKAALDGAKSLKDLKKIRDENAHMMKNPALPQTVKDYFADKIAALESSLT